MEQFGNVALGTKYKSTSQQVRVISEEWIARNGYCIKCSADRLSQTRTNTKSRDFFCAECHHGYELKSKQGTFSSRIVDGAYSAMMKTIREGNTPTFLLLEYSPSWSIQRLLAIHHSLITTTSVEARKPLSPAAKRAGWIGCNIVLPAIPVEGHISIFDNGAMLPKHNPREAFSRLEVLAQLPYRSRSWVATVLNLLHRLPSRKFALPDVYRYEAELQRIYPQNSHLKPKIRQQLQVLRDAGFIHFLGKGQYELAYAAPIKSSGSLV